ncbi:conserved hypothetical protein; putative inner membrane protein [Shewanella benthica]|uniref:Inner membrane protein YjdF n=1 Tax=Shewanella benthica TaxID=43661 RepID=A0A330MA37_9GAMM|nr:DUF2238 domain-containing protein [Shewanella benthica]SQH78294.1 conserved hypothetical protein; putative inner membrane protein [Shewanella benthica]
MNKQLIWVVIFLSALVWSAIEPKDPFTWFLEVLPALIVLLVLFLTRERFPLTPLAYVFILLHCLILMVGGHYTYAEVPIFDWIAEITGSDRNNYDKLGHLAQGFVPTLVAREIFIRLDVVKRGAWCDFLSLCLSLAFSAFYELIEWWVALLTGEDAEAFLGTQGYIWDTQSDMGMALVGAIMCLVILARFHDSQLAKFNG